MLVLISCFLGFILDLLFGDPSIIIHPVVIIGRLISRLECFLRSHFPATSKGEIFAGSILAFIVPVLSAGFTFGLCFITYKIHPLLSLFIQTVWCWQALAIKGLSDESKNVYNKVSSGDIRKARIAVGRIVGRDTNKLSFDGIIKATIETVAENFSDGVFAPMFYMFIGGAPLALVYKSINTMDSMIGYKNEKYYYFGRAAAKLDDIANYIPSRIAALFWILSAFITKQNGKGSFKIWLRDRRCHASPNSAQTESACAGALDIQLAGPAWYFGKLYNKPTIGDNIRPVVNEDILKANKMLYTASFMAFIFIFLIRIFIIIL